MDDLILLSCFAIGFALFSQSKPATAAPAPQAYITAVCDALTTDLVDLTVFRDNDNVSYFDVTISGAGAPFDGTWPGWCIDALRPLASNVLTGFLYCAHDPNFLDLGLLGHPENIDLLNYLLNQHYVGKPAGVGGVYTVGDVQRAIWEIISVPIAPEGINPWSQDRVDEITADVFANGEGYVPPCDGVLGIGIVPFTDNGQIRQILVIEYPLECEPPPPPPVIECETLFGRLGDNNTCFLDLGFDRWGWTNGPLEPGTYFLELWAGAGQCDLSKGTLVGMATIEYDGSTVTVEYEMFDGFVLDETHVYVGNDPTPSKKGKPTVAPGQYGNQHDLDNATSDSFEIDASGDIYVIVHGVVCSEAEAEEAI